MYDYSSFIICSLISIGIESSSYFWYVYELFRGFVAAVGIANMERTFVYSLHLDSLLDNRESLFLMVDFNTVRNTSLATRHPNIPWLAR